MFSLDLFQRIPHRVEKILVCLDYCAVGLKPDYRFRAMNGINHCGKHHRIAGTRRLLVIHLIRPPLRPNPKSGSSQRLIRYYQPTPSAYARILRVSCPKAGSAHHFLEDIVQRRAIAIGVQHLRDATQIETASATLGLSFVATAKQPAQQAH